MEARNMIPVAAFVTVFSCLSFLAFFPNTSFALTSFNVANNTFIFNPRTLSYKAINSRGKVVKRGRASGGRKGRRTPVGHFRVIRKQGASCYSSRYKARMPYCFFFRKLYAIHGFSSVPGYNASHGCIRLPISDAKWLYHNFMRHGTRVIVKPY